MAAFVAPLALVVGLALPSAAFAGEASATLPGVNEGEWTGVEVEPAPAGFTAISKSSVLWTFLGPTVSCEVVLKGTIGPKGEDAINVAESQVNGGGLCEEIELLAPEEEDDWQSQICQFTPSTPDQYWDQLRVLFETPLGPAHGFIYVHLLNAAKADASPLTVAFASAGERVEPGDEPAWIDNSEFGIQADDKEGSEMFAFTPDTIVVTSNLKEKCQWDFTELNG